MSVARIDGACHRDPHKMSQSMKIIIKKIQQSIYKTKIGANYVKDFFNYLLI